MRIVVATLLLCFAGSVAEAETDWAKWEEARRIRKATTEARKAAARYKRDEKRGNEAWRKQVAYKHAIESAGMVAAKSATIPRTNIYVVPRPAHSCGRTWVDGHWRTSSSGNRHWVRGHWRSY